MIDLESLPDKVGTAFDEADDDVMIPRFRSPQLKKSFTDFGYFALPVSARLPQTYGNGITSGLNLLTTAMRALSRGKLRTALTKARDADRQFSAVEAQINNTLDGYRSIMRKTQDNPELMNLDMREMAQATGDQALLSELAGIAAAQTPKIAQGRLNELDKFGYELQLKRDRLKLDTIKTIFEAHKMLKPVEFEDITTLDRINQERALSGMAPMTMEEYMHFKSNTKENEPPSVQEFEKTKTDPEFGEFLKGKKSMPNKIQEYEYAKSQGYGGSLVEYIKETQANSLDALFGGEETGVSPGTQQMQGDPKVRTTLAESLKTDDPAKVKVELEEAFKKTGDDKFNPANYTDILGGSVSLPATPTKPAKPEKPDLWNAPAEQFLGEGAKMEERKEPVWNTKKGGWDLPQ